LLVKNEPINGGKWLRKDGFAQNRSQVAPGAKKRRDTYTAGLDLRVEASIAPYKTDGGKRFFISNSG
jgi:hypothetical protein